MPAESQEIKEGEVQIKRQVAFKVYISDIINGEYVKQEGWNPNYVILDDKKVSRVNLLATVVSKFSSEDGNYAALTLDDGTETIRVKAFGPDVMKVREIGIGNIVSFIGKVKQYNNETYLAPEGVRKVDDINWILVRKLELGKPRKIAGMNGKKIKVISEDEAREKLKEEDKNITEKVANLIRALDKGEGAEIDQVIAGSGLDEDEAKNIIISLLKSGDVYEPKKGKLKMLD